MDYLNRAKALYDETVAHRRALHQMPETGMELPKTMAYLENALREMGCDPVPCGGGLVVTLGKAGGKTILLRADADGLPMHEESGLDFAAAENAHTCGHDLHAAMLLTAAKMLKENESALNGRVKLMFQPGEETFQGAKSMIAAGVLEDPRPDVALACHVTAGRMPLGLFCYNKSGTMMNSSDNFTITIRGAGTHGAYPDRGVDPITIAAHVILALESVMAREVKSTQASVLTIGKVAAGDAGNIIPDSAALYGTMRCDDARQREFLLRRLREVAEGTAATHRGTAQVTVTSGTPPLVCDTAATEAFVGYMKELPVPGQREYPGIRAAASEDWAAVLEQIPGTYIFLSAGFTDRDPAPQHHPAVVFNEEVLGIGPAYLAHCATRWLEEHS